MANLPVTWSGTAGGAEARGPTLGSDMVLRGFERRLERLVEGTFARVFRSGLQPVELGRRLVRVMDEERTIDVKGRAVTANDYLVGLNPFDHRRFSEVSTGLEAELTEAAREHARERGYTFMGPLTVHLASDPKLREGQFSVVGQFQQGPGGSGAGALRFADGTRFPLGDGVVTIGRADDCELVIDDPRVSRRHAEIRPSGPDYLLVDLGSTNGTLVNGHRVTSHLLVGSDRISISDRVMEFEAS